VQLFLRVHLAYQRMVKRQEAKGKRIRSSDDEKATWLRRVLAGSDPFMLEKQLEKQELEVCLLLSFGFFCFSYFCLS
jgi:hypothetical protein